MSNADLACLVVPSAEPVHSSQHCLDGPAAATFGPEVRLLPIKYVRQDGQTQHRLLTDPAVVAEYAGLIRDGVSLPPIRVWFDGHSYWLSDGFQRIAAAGLAGSDHILAEIRPGTLADAQWDSYAANGAHGLRRTSREIGVIVGRALQHANAAGLSNVELAKHLCIPEATLRRWRARLAPSTGEDQIRVVTRGQSTYAIRTGKIGKSRKISRGRTTTLLRQELGEMKVDASPNARRLLNIVGNWLFRSSTSTVCLEALEKAISEWTITPRRVVASAQDNTCSISVSRSPALSLDCTAGSSKVHVSE